MMVSSCNPQFLNPRLSLWLLALFLTMTWHLSAAESAAQIQLRGEVGGNVTFRCPVNKQKTIKFSYLQKGHIFVNGYHASRPISSHMSWENTRLDSDKTTVYMNSLNISHSGDYQCHIMYNDSGKGETVIRLSVTANYSRPEATVSCGDGLSCLVTCDSHGGYPGTKMMWNVTGSQMWRVVNSSEMNDPVTMMVNSSSTVYFNCSSGERNLSCYVGDVTSDTFPICTPKEHRDTSNTYVIAVAICAVGVFSIIIIMLVLWRKRKRGQKGGQAPDVRQECGVNGCTEEVISLKENKGGEEAS